MALVLVAYASKYGTTQEVAERVAGVLERAGIDVEARDADDVGRLVGYDGVVIGGALYFFHWMKDARHLITRHRKELEGIPVALFALGPFESTDEQLAEARKPLDKFLEGQDWLEPASTAIFGGAMDPEKLRFPDTAMKKMGPTDARDWDAIEAWAASLPAAFGLGSS